MSATAGLPVSFSATASDLFSAVAPMTWSFGDGASGTGGTLTHRYAKPGTYTVTVTATDAVGNATSASREIAVAPQLAVCADSAAPARYYCPPFGGCGARACPPPLQLRCTVPHLKGLSRSAAQSRLRTANCRLGSVSVARRYRHAKRLVVASQSIKAGSRIAADASVAITLAPRPRPRHRRPHHRRRHH
jgi:PKD domain